MQQMLNVTALKGKSFYQSDVRDTTWVKVYQQKWDLKSRFFKTLVLFRLDDLLACQFVIVSNVKKILFVVSTFLLFTVPH